MMRRSNVVALDVTYQHTLRAGALPPHHRDPFDRLLIAQAQIERLQVMTTDAAFRHYDVGIVDC
jgi:PIN domain nuclease of toxin-antitoxin system